MWPHYRVLASSGSYFLSSTVLLAESCFNHAVLKYKMVKMYVLALVQCCCHSYLILIDKFITRHLNSSALYEVSGKLNISFYFSDS